MMQARLLQGFCNRAAPGDDASRSVSWILSNEDVCLDFHTIATAGWDLDDFLRNPVLLWAHDQSQPPIGKWTRVEKRGALLVGESVFAEAEDYPFADTIFRLVKGGFLNAVSVSWFPLDSKPARDRARPDGIDFLKQRLLEASVVPVPANPGALATARNLGIDTAPVTQWAERVLDGAYGRRIADLTSPQRADLSAARTLRAADPPPAPRGAGEKWKCGATRNLDVVQSAQWSAADATEALFRFAKLDTPKPDLAVLRKAFLIYDDAAPKRRSSYLLPIAEPRGARLVASMQGLRAAAASLRDLNLQSDLAAKARDFIDHYEGKMPKPSNTKTQRMIRGVSARGLYEVADLAYYLGGIGWLKCRVDAEEAAEGDTDSPNPQNLAAALQALGKALVEMTAEEVSELLETFGAIEEIDGEGDAEQPGERAAPRALLRAMLNKSDRGALEKAQQHCARSQRLLRTHIDRYAESDLSDETTRAEMSDSAEGVHDHLTRSVDMLRDYIGDRSISDDDEDDAGKGGSSDSEGQRATPPQTKPSVARGKPAAAPATQNAATNRSAEERAEQAARLIARDLIDRA